MSVSMKPLAVLDAKGKQISVNIELADNFLSRALGLMFRTRLENNQGMLFVFNKQGHYPLWMLFTFIPLEALFISADGTIVEIIQLSPHDLTSKVSSDKAQYILELPAGFSSKNAIKKGCKVCFG